MNFAEVKKKENLDIKSMVNSIIASRNIKNFGLKRQNLIGLSPAVSGAEGMELSAVVEAKKCQYM